MAQTTPKTVLESLAQDIAAVLKSMGGSAHQNLVVDCVAALRRQRGEAVDAQALRQTLQQVVPAQSQVRAARAQVAGQRRQPAAAQQAAAIAHGCVARPVRQRRAGQDDRAEEFGPHRGGHHHLPDKSSRHLQQAS